MTADWVAWAVPKPSLAELVRGERHRERGYGAPDVPLPARTAASAFFPRGRRAQVEHIRANASSSSISTRGQGPCRGRVRAELG